MTITQTALARRGTMVAGIALIAMGIFQIVAEVRAGWQLDDLTAGIANGDGLVAERSAQDLQLELKQELAELRGAMTLDQSRLGNDARRQSAPFDPVLMSLSGITQLIAQSPDVKDAMAKLDQAYAIAPQDRRVLRLRQHAQMMLQTRPAKTQPTAGQGQAVK